MEFASKDLTAGQLNAMVKKLGGPEQALKLLRGELAVAEIKRPWREENGIIYLTVTSDGTTGPEWIKRLENKGFRVSKYAKDLLNSTDFVPTTGVTYEVAVLRGMLFNDAERVTKHIRAKADELTLTTPNAEVACLLRELLSDKDIEAMGLWWVTIMHEPIKDSDGDPDLLGFHRHDEGLWLGAGYDGPGYEWYGSDGFAFVSQVSTEN